MPPTTHLGRVVGESEDVVIGSGFTRMTEEVAVAAMTPTATTVTC